MSGNFTLWLPVNLYLLSVLLLIFSQFYLLHAWLFLIKWQTLYLETFRDTVRCCLVPEIYFPFWQQAGWELRMMWVQIGLQYLWSWSSPARVQTAGLACVSGPLFWQLWLQYLSPQCGSLGLWCLPLDISLPLKETIHRSSRVIFPNVYFVLYPLLRAPQLLSKS